MDVVTDLLTSQLLTRVLVLSTMLLVLAPSWRLGLLALLFQYTAIGGLLAHIVAPSMGGLQLIVGALICLILYLTIRRVNSPTARGMSPWLWISHTLFRLAALALIGLGAFSTSVWQRFSHLPTPLSEVALWLMGSGLLIALLRPTWLWVGLASLTFVSGLELLQSVSLVGRWWEAALWSGGSLFLAVIIAALLLIHSEASAAPRGRRS